MSSGHDHHAGHHHDHTPGHVHAPADFGRAFAIGIGVNLAYVAVEAAFGVASHSLALVADAGHNLGDVLGLAAAWAAAVLGRRRPSGRYTYGLRRSSILVALGNAIALMVVVGGVAWEALRRLMDPEPSAGLTIAVVAAVGVAVNGGTALLFAAGRRGDINIAGAYAHLAADALVSVGVVASGGLILATGWTWLDPAVSLAVGAVIVAGTWSLLRHALDLALDAVPPAIDRQAVERFLAAVPGVSEVHDLHIWAMSTTETALTAHLVRPGGGSGDALLADISDGLQDRFGIGHATIQFEDGDGAPCRLASGHVV